MEEDQRRIPYLATWHGVDEMIFIDTNIFDLEIDYIIIYKLLLGLRILTGNHGTHELQKAFFYLNDSTPDCIVLLILLRTFHYITFRI